ncbi:MAG: polysaccharide biosynthesis protein [Geminicoccales bacterium]
MICFKTDWKVFIRQRLLSVLHDFSMATFAFAAAFVLRYGINGIGPEQTAIIQFGAPLFGLVVAILSFQLGLSQHLWRYTTADDLLRILATVAAATILVFLSFFLTSRLDGVPRSVPIILAVLTMTLLAGPRFLARMAARATFLEKSDVPANSIQLPVMLIGLGAKTEMFLRWAKRADFMPHRPVAILDLEGRDVGRTLHGIPIVGPGGSLDEIINWLGEIDQKPAWMIVCEKVDADVMAELIRVAGQHEVKVSKMPSMMTLSDASSAGAKVDLKPIAIEDLLGRSQVKLDLGSLSELITGRRVVVTGGGGTIGGELCRQILSYEPEELCVLDNCEYNLYAIEQDLRTRAYADTTRIVPILTDVRDSSALAHKFETHKPALIFHAAALKHVPMVEANPIEAIRTNVFGTRNVANAAKACGALGMVLISTDKSVNPTSIMGATKWLAEQYCQAKDLLANENDPTRFIVVRFGNVLGSSGSVVPLFKKQLAAGGPLTITHPDITRYFMTVREATQLVLQAAAHSLDGGEARGNVLVLDMGTPVKVYELACHMARLAGLEPGKDIEIKSIGLRPGEKLYEELFATHETQLTAKIDGVNVAYSTPPSEEALNGALRRLEEVVPTHQRDEAVAILNDVVVGFQGDDGRDKDDGKKKSAMAAA